MAKNDRFVVRHEDGWAVKKMRAGRSSSVHPTQKEAERRAKEIVDNLGGGEVRIHAEVALSGIPTRWDAAMIRTHRLTAVTESSGRVFAGGRSGG